MQLVCDVQRAVSAYDDKRVNTELLHVSNYAVREVSFDLLSFYHYFGREGVAPVCSPEDRTASVEDPPRAPRGKFFGIGLSDQALKPVEDPHDLPAILNMGRLHNSPYHSVQARSVSAAGQYPYYHMLVPPQIYRLVLIWN